jgi:hypothetical protein
MLEIYKSNGTTQKSVAQITYVLDCLEVLNHASMMVGLIGLRYQTVEERHEETVFLLGSGVFFTLLAVSHHLQICKSMCVFT